MTLQIKQSTGPEFSRILGLGAARGTNVVTNDDIAGPIDSSDEWIQQRTGIITRRRSDAHVTVIDLAEEAALKAIAAAGITAQEIDAVILSTVTYFHQTPAGAALVADRIGATPAAAFDISAACAGYSYGIGQADALVRSGGARNVLVIGAEKMSDFIDPTDRSISFLLGDGAGAAVVGPSDTPGIGPTIWGSDGSKAQTIRQTHSWQDLRTQPEARLADAAPGGPDGLQVGRVPDARRRAAGARRRRCDGRRHPGVRAPPGQHADHRPVHQAAEAPRHGCRRA